MKTRFIHCLLGMVAAGVAFGQDRPAFDAVSIKPSSPDARGSGYRPTPGRLTMKNMTLKGLVEFAYDLHDYQVSGGPGWAETDHYDVLASFPADTPDARRGLMMQATLADRFGLGVRRESKEISGFVLTVAKNGHKLHVADGTDHELMMDRTPAGQRTLNAGSVKMADMASLLADLLRRPVVDKTELQGIYDFKLAWTPDSGTDLVRKGGPEPPPPPPADGQAGPSLFTALQDTLGLKLETGKATVDTIVIERAEKPSEN